MAVSFGCHSVERCVVAWILFSFVLTAGFPVIRLVIPVSGPHRASKVAECLGSGTPLGGVTTRRYFRIDSSQSLLGLNGSSLTEGQ